MTSPALSSRATSLARTTIRLVWANFGLFVLAAGLAVWAGSQAGGVESGQPLVFIGIAPVLGLPQFRYVTWLHRVQRGVATNADQFRVVAWMGWGLVGYALSVPVSGGAVLATVLGALGPVPVNLGRPDVVALMSAFPMFLVGTGMLAYARPWVRALTAAQGAGRGRSQRLTPAVRAATPWVRASQVALLLTPLLDALQTSAPHRWVSMMVAFLPSILILECSLRFPWASAQEPPLH